MKFSLIFFLITLELFSQSFTLSGVIVDSLSGEKLVSANVFIPELDLGTSADEGGEFQIENLKRGNYLVAFSYLGYKKRNINIDLNKDVRITVKLSKISLKLENLLVEGSFPKFRETAVSFSEFTSEDINQRLGSKEAVNIIEYSPSAYISQQGGGIGEQRLNLRGFDQTNVSVMLNGIPINNPENGEIYWSNWAGISDLIKYVHVQRGLSAVPYSTSSIGGNVNFITFGTPLIGTRASIKTEFGSYNLKKNSLTFSAGLGNGFSLTGLISKRDMDGYADQVYSDELTFYLALSMIKQNHLLQVQFFGSPQKHGQRLTQQTIAAWHKRGRKYNADWGYLNGKPLNLRDNEFYNPTININHNWYVSGNIMFTNILTLSRGSGGGTVPPWYPELLRTEEGLINFDREWAINSNNIDPDFHSKLNRSVLALRKGIHKNYWGTLVSSLNYKINNFNFSLGIDGKIYKAQNYNELSNLLGGDYYIGSNDLNADPDKLLMRGDKVDFNADSFSRTIGGFALAEFKTDYINVYLNLALTKNSYNRIDYFNYLENDPKRETGWKSFTGTTLKAGLNFNIDHSSSLFMNIGHFSRPPLSNNVFDYSNNLYENVKNENIYSFEGGYSLEMDFLKLQLNYYQTIWNDKAFSQTYLNTDSTALYYLNIFGASARHSGIEVEGMVFPHRSLQINASFSLASHKWNSDVDAYLRPESNPSDEIKYRAFTDGLYVGNHPMTTASLGIFYTEKISENVSFYLNPVYSLYGKYYANYNPELRTDINEKNLQPWKLPDFSNVDFHTGMNFDFQNIAVKSIKLNFHIFNLMNEDYIIDAVDGIDHTASSARVWYGNRRWWSTSLSVNF